MPLMNGCIHCRVAEIGWLVGLHRWRYTSLFNNNLGFLNYVAKQGLKVRFVKLQLEFLKLPLNKPRNETRNC